MTHRRRVVLIPWLFTMLLVFGAPGASAGECPLATDGSNGYDGVYKSSIGLPRCNNAKIAKWSVCEVCMISDGMFTDPKDPYTQSYTANGTGGLQPRTTFMQGSTPFIVNGFFDGIVSNKAVFRVRFTPTTENGMITFTTMSSDTGLQVGGQLTAAAPATGATGFLRRDPQYPTSFVFDDSTTHPFIWGQTYYQIVNDARSGNLNFWRPAVNGSAGYNMNKIRLLVSSWAGDAHGGPNDPHQHVNASMAFQKAGTKLDRNLLDLAHWQALDQVTNFLKNRNLIADLILFHDGDDTNSPYSPDPVQNQRYTNYTVARYAAFTNVIWTLANEYQLITTPAGQKSPIGNDAWDDIGCLIRGHCKSAGDPADPWIAKNDLWRPLSIHNNINTDDLHMGQNGGYPCFEFFAKNWPTHVALQTKRTDKIEDLTTSDIVNQNLTNCRAGAAQLPVINDEFYYLGTPSATDDRLNHREGAWGIAMTRGFGSTGSLKGPSTCTSCDPTRNTDWVDETDAYGDIKTLSSFFTSTLTSGWWKMTPTARLSSVPPAVRAYGLDSGGQEQAFYIVKNGATKPVTFKVQLDDAVAPKMVAYAVTFVDPSHARAPVSQERRITAPGPYKFSTPPLKAPATKWDDWAMRIASRTSFAAPADEVTWVGDALPAGAIPTGDGEGWNWIDEDPVPVGDNLAHTSNSLAGMHQHYFTGATNQLSVGTGNYLFAYVYLDPIDTPTEVMLQWNDGSWNHRAYWGANQLPWGKDNSTERRYMGPLPDTDQWVRLQVAASDVGLEGRTLNGMAFSLFGGKATWDDAGRAGSFVRLCDPSQITQQPQSQTIIPGASATLSVAATGTGPFNYQFYQAPVGQYQNPTGLSTATISTGPITTTKQYWAEINDTCQGTFLHSDAAIVTVQCTAAPLITQPPTSRVTSPGQSTTLSVAATQAVNYQWFQGSTPLLNETNPTLTVHPQSTTSYWVHVTNDCGLADSATATVCVLPVVDASPTPRTINPGQSTTLTVSARNVDTYQWYAGTYPSITTPIGGSSSALTVSPGVTTSYWVRVTNTCGVADSATVTVWVAPPPPPYISRMQSVSVPGNSQSSLTARWPMPTQPGTFLVAVVSGLKDPAALDWIAPAGWQQAVVQEWPNVKLAIYYLPNNAGARIAETFAAQVGYHDMTLYVAEYSGIVAANPLDKVGSTGALTNNGYVQTGYTPNTVQPKELVVTALTTYAQTDFTVSPIDGYTEVFDQSVLYHLTTAMYERFATSIGSYGHSANVSVPAEYAGVVATFRATIPN